MYSPHNGISGLLKRGQETSLSLGEHWERQSEKAAICNPGREFSADIDPVHTLTLNFKDPPELWQISFHCLTQPMYVILLWQLKQIKTGWQILRLPMCESAFILLSHLINSKAGYKILCGNFFFFQILCGMPLVRLMTFWFFLFFMWKYLL